MGAPHGQHFLVNRAAAGTILARFAPRPEDYIVEIGPGRGALTRSLLERARLFAAIEIDPDLARSLAVELGIPILEETELTGNPDAPHFALAGAARNAIGVVTTGGAPQGPSPHRSAGSGPLRFIVRADALQVRYADLAAALGAGPTDRLRVIGNLPYSVATALLQRMAAERDRIEDVVVMVQKEVADRILASPGGRVYGILSVLLALASERSRVLNLGPHSFSPPPKVDSSVIRIRFHRPAPGFRDADAALISLLKASFSERRKKLSGNLARHYALDKLRAAELIAAAGADPGARAEQLAPEAFRRLADLLTSLR